MPGTRKPILELGDLVPEYIPIRINRIVKEFIGPDETKHFETEMVTLQAYLYGPRTPVVVKSALRQITQRFAKEMEEEGYSDELFQRYARDSFIQLIPGITFEEADVLASDDESKTGLAVKTLKYLEYWMFKGVEEAGELEDTGEVKGEEKPITEKSSPISA